MKRLLIGILVFTALLVPASLRPGIALASCSASPGASYSCSTFYRSGSFRDSITGQTIATWTYQGSYWWDTILYVEVRTDTSDGWSGYGHSVMTRNMGYPSLTITLTSYWDACVHRDSLNRCDTWQWTSVYTFHCPSGQTVTNVWIAVEASRQGYTTQDQNGEGQLAGCMR